MATAERESMRNGPVGDSVRWEGGMKITTKTKIDEYGLDGDDFAKQSARMRAQADLEAKGRS